MSDPGSQAHRWDQRRERKRARLKRAQAYISGRAIPSEAIVEILESLIEPGDRICLEGDNQKQADFLSRSLAAVNPERVHDVHLLLSVLGRPEHIALFERGIAGASWLCKWCRASGRACNQHSWKGWMQLSWDTPPGSLWHLL